MRSLALALFLAATSAAAASWQVGSWSMTYQYTCFNNGYGAFADTYAGYYGDGTTPRVGDVYYGELGVAIVGSSCNGGALAHIEVTLPPATELAISDQTPIVCRMIDIQSGAVSQLTGGQCVQDMSPTAAIKGQYYHEAIWVPYGKNLEIWFPMRSKKTLSGTAGNEYLSGAVELISDTTQWSYPKEGVFVYPNPPELSYPAEATTEISTTAATLHAEVVNHYAAGTVSFDLGTSTAYELGSESGPLGDDVDGQSFVDARAELEPSTTYHWRVRFVDDSGAETVGADQTFRTLDLPTYSLTVNAVDEGTADVTPELASYPEGTSVTLTAHPAEGYQLAGWIRDGADAGTENPLTITVTADTVIEPRFTPVATQGGDAPDAGSPTSGGSGTPSSGGSDTPSSGGAATPTSVSGSPAQTGGCNATGAEAGMTPLLLLVFARRRRSARRA